MNRELQVALIGLASVVITAVLGPVLRTVVARLANGRVHEARDRRRFFAESVEREERQQERLLRLEEEVEELRRTNMELERRIVQVDELAIDLAMLRDVIEKHLQEHPQFHRMMAMLETMHIRMGRGIREVG